ncbi:D-alanyl-D-alanine carboxypeptidase/D-alanyl-D-alanine-endopeptidase [Lentzea alba]|uniref:D-alanyl-D-alanine carboxypeptidase/D-alanyl-D-alanine endopeptidase n=1 Tax=Lentzea alba TaxID=2714351 RepID=UPI0039BF7D8C
MKFRILGAVVAVAAGLTLTSSGGATAVGNEELTADLDAILANAGLRGADVGITVRDTSTGEVVYTRSGSKRSQVASNTKLVTTTAALDLLGPDFKWKTELVSAGSRSGSTLNGDLVLRGGGDPTMSAQRYKALADALKNSGVTKVNGALLLDDTAFDGVPFGPGWAWDDEPYAYNAETSALTVSADARLLAGTVNVRVKPGAADGAPAQVSVEPANDHVQIVNNAITGSGSVSATREHGTNRIVVNGSIAKSSEDVLKAAPVQDPTSLVSSVFQKALQANGIQVTGGARKAKAPQGAAVLATETSKPLSELVNPLLKESNNMMSEALVKTAGRTWSNGINQLSTKWGGLGVDANWVEIFDGSGMSRFDQISPDDLTWILTKAKAKPWFVAWATSLPIAGYDGTLANRMGGTAAQYNVWAKTGSMTGVSALTGYVTTGEAQPRQFAFSIVQNNFVLNPNVINPRSIEDAIAVRLAEQGRTTATLSTAQLRGQGEERLDVECSWIGTCK